MARGFRAISGRGRVVQPRRLFRGPRGARRRLARRSPQGQEILARTDPGGGSPAPSWEWEFSGSAVGAQTRLSQSLALSGRLWGYPLSHFTALDFRVAAGF